MSPLTPADVADLKDGDIVEATFDTRPLAEFVKDPNYPLDLWTAIGPVSGRGDSTFLEMPGHGRGQCVRTSSGAQPGANLISIRKVED